MKPGTREGWGALTCPSSLAPPRPNLGRPVWRACCPRDHLGLERKRLQLQPRSPLGVVLPAGACKQHWSSDLALFQSIPRMSLLGRTLGQLHCHWYVCRPGLLFGHPWTRYYMSYKNVVNTTQQDILWWIRTNFVLMSSLQEQCFLPDGTFCDELKQI